jgi:hypothetical protein
MNDCRRERTGLSFGEKRLSGLVDRHPAGGIYLGEVKVQLCDHVGQDASNERSGGVLVIGWHDVPGCPRCRRRSDRRLVGVHIVVEIRPLRQVGCRELPVLGRVVEPFEEPPLLLVLRDMEEKLDEVCSVTLEVMFERVDVLVPLLPKLLPACRVGWEVLFGEDVGMDAGDEDLLIVGTVEDPDPPSSRKRLFAPPQEVMTQFVGRGSFECRDLAALGVSRPTSRA